MDIKQLIEKMDQFAGQAVGQKPGDQWRGTDKGTPGKKLVGGGDEQQESVLKDLNKGRTPKTREQELAEERGEHGLSNFLADRQDAFAKHAWFLRSTLKD